MAKIKILKETEARRCEICHQTDCYDPATNYCSRCSNINTLNNNATIITDQLLGSANSNNKLVKPAALEITDTGLTYAISYRWRSYNHKNNLFFIILFWIISLNALKEIVANPLAIIPLSIIPICAFLIVFINSTTITISRTKLVKDSGPIAFSAKKEILLADIKYIHYERHLHNSGRLLVRLNNDKLIELIHDIGDRDSMRFIEQTLKEKIKHLSISTNTF